MREKDLFPLLIKHRHFVRHHSPQDDYEKFPSQRYGGISSYQASFATLLRGQTLPEMVELWKAGREKVVGVDLLGYGYIFFKDLPVDFGLAVSLALPLPEEISQLKSCGRIDFIPGTVASKRLWREISAWLAVKQLEYKTDGFKLILARPAALDNQVLPRSEDLLYWIANQAWKTLGIGGVILAQFPEWAIGTVEPWIAFLKTQKIMAAYQKPEPEMGAALPAIRLDKTASSPIVLPSFIP